MIVATTVICAAIAPMAVAGLSDGGRRNAAGKGEFLERIAPIFQRHCYRCHNDAKRQGAWSIETAESFRAGGDSGDPLTPGDPESSYLLDLITPGDDGQAEMPKESEPLSADDVAAIREWIKSGAVWPDGVRIDEPRVTDVDWWSWRPLVRPDPPTLSDAEQARARTPIDAFLIAALRERQLSFAPEADRRTLIRRLYFDLIGLPPPPDEVERFLDSDDPRAYERLVDRLLESPHYGERWARHWLDVVHYGDTHGYDKDKLRPNAWPYRDYVIRSLNADKPYGRFVREQIAGDVLFPHDPDGVVATGFIASGPWDFISHVEVPETKIDGQVARSLDRDDMVRVTMETFNSVTIGCARCHHHKFDPVTQQDYYSLQSIFAAVDRADRPFDADPAVFRRRRELLARQSELSEQTKRFDEEIRESAGKPLANVVNELDKLAKQTAGEPRPEFGWHSGIEPSADREKWVQVDLGRPVAIDRVVFVGCHDDFNNIGAGFGFPVRFRVEACDDGAFAKDAVTLLDRTSADVANPGVDPQSINVGGTTTARYVRITATKLAPRKDDYIFALAEMMVFDADGTNAAAGAEVTSLDSIEAPVRWSRKNLVDGYYFGVARDPDSQKRIAELQKRRDELIAAALTPERRAARDKALGESAEVESALKSLPAPEMVYAAATQFAPQGNFHATGGRPREIHVLRRGNVLAPDELAQPGALAAFASLGEHFDRWNAPVRDGSASASNPADKGNDPASPTPADSDEGARRVALADWLADERNPLTWRSIVNRVWQHHFGRGIVDSPNDFGRMGQLPSHPELLDWLAVEFRDGGQSLKSLHRLICLSAAYRQASTEREEGTAVDADNRLLWRMNRRRLDAESLRDAVLQVSGSLDDTMYGPGFQDFVIEKPEHSPHYQYHLHDPTDPRSHRRTVYRFIVRSQQQPFMTTMDCADPSMQVDKRNETVTPQQALALLNNRFMLAMSHRFAVRLRDEKGEEDSPPTRESSPTFSRAVSDSSETKSQIAHAFRLALARDPSPQELERFASFADSHGLENVCRVIFNLNEFLFVD